MSKKKSGPAKSFSPSPKRRPKEEVAYTHKRALAAPKELSGTIAELTRYAIAHGIVQAS
ncbi:MAG: hypothetical protein ABSG32_18910 [Terriglobia bacterium]|jgi:hypothetical protein